MRLHWTLDRGVSSGRCRTYADIGCCRSRMGKGRRPRFKGCSWSWCQRRCSEADCMRGLYLQSV